MGVGLRYTGTYQGVCLEVGGRVEVYRYLPGGVFRVGGRVEVYRYLSGRGLRKGSGGKQGRENQS